MPSVRRRVRYGVRSWKAPWATNFWNAAPLFCPFWLKLMYVMSGKVPPAASVFSLAA